MNNDDEDDNVVDLDAKRNEKRRKNQSDKENEFEDLLAAADEWLNENPIREVLKLRCYFVQKSNREWIAVKRANFSSHWPEWSDKFAKAVTHCLRARGWAYLDATYTYASCPSDTFNMLDRSGWILPDEGEYHWLFDVLMQSLSGNKPENLEHLEHVLVHKYLNPWAYTLPCLLIHGEGGVGKNVLVDIALYKLFDEQTYSGRPANVIGDFNGTLKGKAVVMINEADSESTNTDELKNTFQSARLTINEKGISQYQVDNTPLYIISSNKTDGGVWLDRSEADRRYSVLHVKKGQSLAYWLALHAGDIPSDQKFLDKTDPIFVKWQQWMLNEGGKILADPHNIANWFGAMFLRHADKPHPLALHGEDFNRLMDIQKPMLERICEAVFSDPDFQHIERKTMHRAYVLLCEQDGQRGHLKQAKFYERVRELAERQWPHLIETQVNVHDPVTSRDTRPEVWIPAAKVQRGGQGQQKHRSTTSKYLCETGYKTTWVGPEV